MRFAIAPEDFSTQLQQIPAARVRLAPRVARLFELELSLLEFQALGASILGVDLEGREIYAHANPAAEERVRGYSAWGESVNGRPTFKSELIGAHMAERLTTTPDNYFHLIYPFKGRMVPSTANALLNITIGPREAAAVLDPMCGSGTVLAEAAMMGRRRVSYVAGVELRPWFAYIARAKLRALEGLRPEEPASYANFKPDWDSGNPITNVVWAYSHFGKPTHQARRFRRRLDLVRRSIEITTQLLRRWGREVPEWDIHVGTATRLPFGPQTFDAVVFSPPYSLALNYDRENPTPPGFPGGPDISQVVDGSDLDTYRDLMRRVYAEVARVLRPGGRVGIVIGNQRYRGKEIDNVGWTVEVFRELGLKLEHRVLEYVSGARSIIVDWALIFSKGE